MKCPFCISLLLGCTVWLAACTGPVIIDEPEDDSLQSGQGEGAVRDSVPIVHEGSYASPYTIAEAQTLGHARDVWVEGYIVGCVSGSMKNGCDYTSKAATASNILLADTFPSGSENDYLHCLPVALPSGSAERDELSLYDNPDNYHRKVRISGDITLYFNVPGLKNVEDYIFSSDIVPDIPDEPGIPEEPETPDTPNEPDVPANPDETWYDTLSIAEGIALQSDWEYHQVYIKGYIIGYTTTSQKVYYDLTDMKKTAKTNVVLADNLEERNCNSVIAVELKEGSYIQQAVNLVDNPQNLHKSLTVKGVMKQYKSLYGCIDIPNGLVQGNDTIKDYYFMLE